MINLHTKLFTVKELSTNKNCKLAFNGEDDNTLKTKPTNIEGLSELFKTLSPLTKDTCEFTKREGFETSFIPQKDLFDFSLTRESLKYPWMGEMLIDLSVLDHVFLEKSAERRKVIDKTSTELNKLEEEGTLSKENVQDKLNQVLKGRNAQITLLDESSFNEKNPLARAECQTIFEDGTVKTNLFIPFKSSNKNETKACILHEFTHVLQHLDLLFYHKKYEPLINRITLHSDFAEDYKDKESYEKSLNDTINREIKAQGLSEMESLRALNKNALCEIEAHNNVSEIFKDDEAISKDAKRLLKAYFILERVTNKREQEHFKKEFPGFSKMIK